MINILFALYVVCTIGILIGCAMILLEIRSRKRRKMAVPEFAAMVCAREGKKKQVDIAQVLEILKIVRELIKEQSGEDIYALMLKERSKHGRGTS